MQLKENIHISKLFCKSFICMVILPVCWDSNLSPPEEQPVLLTAEPSLQFLQSTFEES